MFLLVRDNLGGLDPGLVQEIVSTLMTGQYCQFAIITLLVYDAGMFTYVKPRLALSIYYIIVITLDREVRCAEP